VGPPPRDLDRLAPSQGGLAGKFEPIPWAYAEIVRVLSRHERVCILVQDAAAEKKARAVLKTASVGLKQVDFFRIPTDRVWTRDSGAIFVKNGDGKKLATHWKFNGWAKYPNHKKDDLVAARIAKAARVPSSPWSSTAARSSWKAARSTSTAGAR
jgi:agmatine deiminase